VQLELFPRSASVPWGGVSPRELTRAFRAFSFTAEGMGPLNPDAPRVGENKPEAPAQLELFPLSGGV